MGVSFKIPKILVGDPHIFIGEPPDFLLETPRCSEVSNENMGSPLGMWGSPMNIWGSETRIWGSPTRRPWGTPMKDDDFFPDLKRT